MSEWTEGICGDGAAILKDGIPVTISEILQQLNRHEWISVEDKKPEGWALGYTPYAYYICMYGELKGHFVDRDFQSISITHWMPLPDPPKKEASHG